MMSISSSDLIPSAYVGFTTSQRDSKQQGNFEHYLNRDYSPTTSSQAQRGISNHEAPSQFMEIPRCARDDGRAVTGSREQVAESGDNYYWQHQAELQQSALQFIQAETQQSPSPDSSSQEKTIEIENFASENKEQEKVTMTPCFNKEYTPYMTNVKIAPIFHEFIKLFQEKSTCLLPITERQIKPLSDKKIPGSTIQIQPFVEKPVFQPYQLFISNKQVELTLNTHALTLDEAKHLEKFIKQWVSSKGFFLNKMIINGVQQ